MMASEFCKFGPRRSMSHVMRGAIICLALLFSAPVVVGQPAPPRPPGARPAAVPATPPAAVPAAQAPAAPVVAPATPQPAAAVPAAPSAVPTSVAVPPNAAAPAAQQAASPTPEPAAVPAAAAEPAPAAAAPAAPVPPPTDLTPAELPRDLTPYRHVHVGGHHRERRDARPGVCLGPDLDDLALEDAGTVRSSGGSLARAQQVLAGRGRSPRPPRPASAASPQVGPVDRRLPQSELRRSPDRHDVDGIKERITARFERIEAGVGRRMHAGDRDPRHHRRDRAVRRPVRHRLGHHEQLHRHFEAAHHQSGGGGAGHRGSAARHRVRPRRRDSRGGDLQHVCALDRQLSRALCRMPVSKS